MNLLAECGRAVTEKNDVVITHEAVSRRRLDAHVGRNAR